MGDPEPHAYAFEPEYAKRIWDAHHTKTKKALGDELKAADEAGRKKETAYLDRLWWYLYGMGSVGREEAATQEGFVQAAKSGVESRNLEFEDEDPSGGRRRRRRRTQKRKATQKRRKSRRRA